VAVALACGVAGPEEERPFFEPGRGPVPFRPPVLYDSFVALSREVKVGAFVAAGLLVAGLVVFLIGDERRAFAKKDRYYVVFEDVQGLTRGSPVRMGGVDVGQVQSVSYGEDARDSRLRVAMDIVRAEARRIRADSTATIGNKGLLGDKMVVIKVGSPEKPPVEAGGTIRSEPPTDLSQITDRLAKISEKADSVMSNLEKTTDTFADPAVREDLRSTVQSISHILKSVDEGDGYVSVLLHDPKEAKRLSNSVANLERASGQLDGILVGVHSAVGRVNQGPGFAHEVIYGEGPSQAIAQIGRAAGELATTLEAVRNGNGLAKSVLYGDDATQQLIGDLNKITRDAREIVEGIKAGKGTIGALMVDPSVYEDVKLLLGNVERNKALRALVRYSIQRDEKVHPVEVKDPVEPRATESGPPQAPSGTVGATGATGRAGPE
jgi:phospholipid/cholesterol/gamma-HCH transport system substrate-binding protein